MKLTYVGDAEMSHCHQIKFVMFLLHTSNPNPRSLAPMFPPPSSSRQLGIYYVCFSRCAHNTGIPWEQTLH